MTNKNRAVFPFRRGNSSKPGGQPPNNNKRRGNRPNPRGGRGEPPAVMEILNQLQPATRALAQFVAGNSRSGGQISQARNLLDRATRLVEQQGLHNVSPATREQFLDQYAKLKLTLTDAERDLHETRQEAEEEALAAPPPPSMDKLRELALSLSRSTAASAEAAAQAEAEPMAEEPEPLRLPTQAAQSTPSNAKPGARLRKPGETLKLKSTRAVGAEQPAEQG